MPNKASGHQRISDEGNTHVRHHQLRRHRRRRLKGANPAVPVTPEEIANEAIAANKAGAAIVHIHVRNPETGKASMDPKLYKEVVDRIRDANAPVIINLTTAPGRG